MRESPATPSTSHRTTNGARLDRAGVIVSGLCMVHCVAGLVLIGVLGLGGGVLLNPAIHHIGLALALAIGVATIGANALRSGLSDAGHRLALVVGASGLSLMAAAVLSHHGLGEAVMTIAGVALVASAHFINLRRAACC
ncbi:MerC domain-containing protein [Novosphingobium sp.]|uniref:MerC domain-containing protein n=1 Tax=Novosphingobium sp. TaxID=1874826 RepID=UPI00333E1BFC